MAVSTTTALSTAEGANDTRRSYPFCLLWLWGARKADDGRGGGAQPPSFRPAVVVFPSRRRRQSPEAQHRGDRPVVRHVEPGRPGPLAQVPGHHRRPLRVHPSRAAA
eukprot:CAMPEP_0194724606 /NCGR_PEP_ID=MMETSP0296-20130528/22546_1 /TAXON_ID=39354 /ORGANISM="Heterosigma akashiwo, Strain CCMP2393" /LENGTH=106 /DNA_ID=CAMNT_0039628697 /DNA_START=204 /DNA_END=521 /DNA_ORIENTATION=-